MFVCKASKCANAFALSSVWEFSTYILLLKKVGTWVNFPWENTFNWTLLNDWKTSQLTYQVVRKTTVRQCHGVAIYSLATHSHMYSIKLHIYNTATNDVKNDMKSQVIRSHLPQKESAGSAGRLKPRVAGQKDVKHRLVCSNWASQTFFQNFIGLAKACRFFGFKGQHQLEAKKPFHEYSMSKHCDSGSDSTSS